MMKLGEMAHGYEPRTFADHPAIVSNTDMVGIEVELEDCPLLTSSAIEELSLWSVTEDSSLRSQYPVEVRFRYPLGGADVVIALEQLEEAITSREITPSINLRTSLHVHMDVRDLDVQELITLCAVYAATEPLLLEYAGKHRKENIYCLPWYKAEHNLLQLDGIEDIINSGNIFNIVHGTHKYSALNLKALHDRGSIEFRLSEAHYHSADILTYINILLKLKQFARSNSDKMLELPKMASGSSLKEFIENIYGEYAEALYYPGCEGAILRGARLAQMMLMGDRINDARNVIIYEWLGEERQVTKTLTFSDVIAGISQSPVPNISIEDTMWAPTAFGLDEEDDQDDF